MMYNTEDFMDLADSDNDDLTVFVPSPESLTNITNPSILTQVIIYLYLENIINSILKSHVKHTALFIKYHNNQN